MSQEYLEAVSNHSKIVRDVNETLREMARAAHTLGYEELSEKLWNCVVKLHNSEFELQGAVSQELTDRVKDGMEQAGNAMKLVLESADRPE